jgi:hypothetical protein
MDKDLRGMGRSLAPQQHFSTANRRFVRESAAGGE